MRIENEFEVAAPLERVWNHVLNVEKVAPCVPGGELTDVVDDHTWKGKVNMKMGPVSLAFTGTVTLQERDDEAHRVVLKAEGREQRGKGAAKAVSTSRLEAAGPKTKIFIETDLTITGAVAQYGRGMIGDISQRLTQQFADCLAANIAVEGASGAPEAAEAAGESSERGPAGMGTPSGSMGAPDAGAGPPKDIPPSARGPVRIAGSVGGIRLGLWALWRAVVRLFRRLFGGRRTS